MDAAPLIVRFTILAALLTTSGCTSGPYLAGRGWINHPPAPPAGDHEDKPAAKTIAVAHGRPNKFIDGVGWVFGIPGKIVYWDRRFENHKVSGDTEAAAIDYVAYNNLEDVTIRVNQYAPVEEWKRLCANKEVGAGWRYTFGVLNWAGYTIFPGRIFGGDRYNPYTNSLYVYSDIAPLALVGAAYAKDVHSRDYPGAYATINEFTVFSLWHSTIATDDALAYLAQKKDKCAYEEGVAFLHPFYGSQVGLTAENLIGGGPLLAVAGAICGHINGQREIRALEQDSTNVATDWLKITPPLSANGDNVQTATQRVEFVK